MIRFSRAMGATCAAVLIMTAPAAPATASTTGRTVYWYCWASWVTPQHITNYYSPVFSRKDNESTGRDQVDMMNLLTSKGWTYSNPPTCQGPFPTYQDAASRRLSDVAGERQKGHATLEL